LICKGQNKLDISDTQTKFCAKVSRKYFTHMKLFNVFTIAMLNSASLLLKVTFVDKRLPAVQFC